MAVSFLLSGRNHKEADFYFCFSYERRQRKAAEEAASGVDGKKTFDLANSKCFLIWQRFILTVRGGNLAVIQGYVVVFSYDVPGGVG